MEADHLYELNYAITLCTHDEKDRAKEHFAEFENLFANLEEEERNADQEVKDQRVMLAKELGAVLDNGVYKL